MAEDRVEVVVSFRSRLRSVTSGRLGVDCDRLGRLTLYLGTGCRLFRSRRSDYEGQAKDRNLQRRMRGR
jgi:hypothetical protein